LKNTALKITAAVLAASALLLTSCGSTLKYKDGKYIHGKTNTAYIAAPLNYEPIEVGEEYAKFGESSICEVVGQDPTSWLAIGVEDIPSLLYSDKIALPSLADFSADKISVYATQNISLLTGEVSDKAVIDAVVSHLANGENTVLPPSLSLVRELKFSSSAYAGIVYTVMYAETADGESYLYDRSSKKCVVCTDLDEMEFVRGPKVQQ